MPKNHRLPRSVYELRIETVKQSGLWSSLGKLSPQGYYIFSLVNQPGNISSLYMAIIVSLVDKPGIHEIWTSKLNLTMKININQSPGPIGILTKVFCTSGPIKIWWSWLEWVTSYRADKLQHTDTHTGSDTRMHTDKRRQQYPKARTGLG